MKHLLCVLALCALSPCLQAQSSDYQVLRGEQDFVLKQNGKSVVFDTASVKVNLQQKGEEVLALESEIATLERLLTLRRQLLAVREEKRTLGDILQKARQCAADTCEDQH